MLRLLVLLLLATFSAAWADEPLFYPWPNLAPGKTERTTGTSLPMRPQDKPPITRVVDIAGECDAVR